jgi:hypothetical protein
MQKNPETKIVCMFANIKTMGLGYDNYDNNCGHEQRTREHIVFVFANPKTTMVEG